MVDLALNSSDDIYLDDAGNLATVDGTDAIDQVLKVRLRTILGEWFLDQNEGLPWFTVIFEKGFSANVIEAIFKDAILASPGITAIESLELDLDAATKTLTVTASLTTEDGSTTEFNDVVTP